MKVVSISEAGKLFLHSQGLMAFDAGRKQQGVLDAIAHLGYVQIDTISVVERAHHHTIYTRVKDYKNIWMN
jgi:uncharacterized protein